MKLYTLGNRGYVNEATRQALGVRALAGDAHVLIAAASKTAAVRLAESRGYFQVRNDHLTQLDVDGWCICLHAAGLFDTERMLTVPLFARESDPVVEVAAGGAPQLIGHLERTNGNAYRFVAEEEHQTYVEEDIDGWSWHCFCGAGTGVYPSQAGAEDAADIHVGMETS